MADNFGGYEIVTITSFRLTSISAGKTIDLRRVLGGFEYYNSIFDPTAYVIAVINDTAGGLYDLPLTGDEIVEIEFNTNDRKAINKIFHVHHIGEINYTQNGSITNFELHMTSLDQINATAAQIQRGFKGILSDLVKSTLLDNAKTSLPIDVEPTKGIEQIIVPNWNAWETIEFCRQRSVSQKYNTPFYFFEDNTGYNFCSLEYLIDKKKQSNTIVQVTAYPFQPGSGDKGNPTIDSSQYRNATNFKILSKAKMGNMIVNGGIHNETVQFDFWAKKTISKKLKFTELSGEIKIPLDDTYNRQFGKMMEAIANTSSTIQYVVPHDSTNATAFSDNVNIRQMVNRHFGDIKVGFTLYGDSQMQAGDLIYLTMPRTVDQDGADSQLTGNFIVANLKHSVKNNAMFTHIEAHRFGFASSAI
jgi:hypothetical protein